MQDFLHLQSIIATTCINVDNLTQSLNKICHDVWSSTWNHDYVLITSIISITSYNVLITFKI